MYEPYDHETATTTDRVAWALCQIIDDDAPLRWKRYRFAAGCIALNAEVMADLTKLCKENSSTEQPASQGQAVAVVTIAGYPQWLLSWLDSPNYRPLPEGTKLYTEQPASQGQAPTSDRAALHYLMQRFDSESWECPKCGHSEDTATMDSADYLRRYLAEHPQPASAAVADWIVELANIDPDWMERSCPPGMLRRFIASARTMLAAAPEGNANGGTQGT